MTTGTWNQCYPPKWKQKNKQYHMDNEGLYFSFFIWKGWGRGVAESFDVKLPVMWPFQRTKHLLVVSKCTNLHEWITGTYGHRILVYSDESEIKNCSQIWDGLLQNTVSAPTRRLLIMRLLKPFPAETSGTSKAVGWNLAIFMNAHAH